MRWIKFWFLSWKYQYKSPLLWAVGLYGLRFGRGVQQQEFFICIINTCGERGFPWIYLTIHLERALLLVNPLDGIQFQHWTDECKISLVGYSGEFKRESRYWVCPCFTCSALYIWFVFSSSAAAVSEFVQNSLKHTRAIPI